MQYRREIDGLRALAVIPVILFHAGFQAFEGGFVGVDIFFVISGYLITSIIISEMESDNFSVVNFYERRARRILPALFFVLALCLPMAWFWLLPTSMKDFSESLIAVPIFSSNILFWRESGYFDTSAELKPLLHTWSLGVEEQFYVLFPLLLMITWRFGKRFVIGVLISTFAISIGLAHWGAFNKPTASFFLLPTRAWELLAGSFIAFYFLKKDNKIVSGHTNQFLSLMGLLLIVYAVLVYDKDTPFPSLYSLVPIFGTVLLIINATPATYVGNLLGRKLFVGIGLISYSAYLWHQPLFAFARHVYLTPGKPLLAWLSLLAVILGYFSWKYVEVPFRSRQRFNRNQIFKYSLFGSSFFIFIGLLGYFWNGFESRLTKEERDILSFEQYDIEIMYRVAVCFLNENQSYTEFKDICRTGVSEQSVLLWGDSHAAALSVGLRKINANVIQYTASGCPPIKDAVVIWRPKCKDINDYVLNEIKRLKPQHIILHANWMLYTEQNPVANIKNSLDYIRSVSPTSQITIVGGVPQWKPSLPVYLLRMHIGLNGEYYLHSPIYNELLLSDRAFSEVAKINNINFLSALSTFCINDKCQVTVKYNQIFMPTAWDYGHLTEGGSVLLATDMVKR